MLYVFTGVFLSRVNSLNTARLNTTKSTKETVKTSGGHNDGPTEQAKACRSGNIKLPGKQKSPPLCGNANHDDDRCLFSCISGGFYHGICTKSDECFCYRNNPQKGKSKEHDEMPLRAFSALNECKFEWLLQFHRFHN